MQDNKRKGEGRVAKKARQDRLKQALRENLKRRKSQAKGRGDATPRDDADGTLHGEFGKKAGD